jgi:hypothetical protein
MVALQKLAPHVLLLLLSQWPITAFLLSSLTVTSYTSNNEAALFAAGDEDKAIDDFESRRMDIVRILQKSYYRNIDDDDGFYESGFGSNIGTQRRTKFDEATGRFLNLPIWRVGWVETPGRRNCLNVHEGQYTHLFETILAQRGDGNGPLYFGHLYVPGGSAKARSPEYHLKTWHQELADESRFDPSILNTYKGSSYVNARAAVVGCLMQIVDFRRMNDGRLMILVQSVERFVVDEVVETQPYCVANVQILLDEEELPWTKNVHFISEDACKYLRGDAVGASFYYHDYEFDKPKLPIPDNREKVDDSEQYLSKDDVPWVSISKLLPFAHYSTDDVSLDKANEKLDNAQISSLAMSEEASGTLPLEQQLQNGAILWKPPPLLSSNVIIRRKQDLDDCDVLETLLWLALDDFCRASGFVLPEEVACLLPPEMDYIDIKPETTLSQKYPKIRRQQRLSYLAPALIENLDVGKELRQVWLNTPSIKARLAGALERFDCLNNELMGEYN